MTDKPTALKAVNPDDWAAEIHARKAVVRFPTGIESGNWQSKPDEKDATRAYIRADLLEAHIGAVLEEAAVVAEREGGWRDHHMAHHISRAIRALRPDAQQAIERVRREARVEGMRAAAHIAVNACLVPPDGGSPTEEERLVCEEAYRRIMAAALIEAERGKP